MRIEKLTTKFQEALADAQPVSGGLETSMGVAIDSLTSAWTELPNGLTTSGFAAGLRSATESLKSTDGEKEPSAAFTGLLPECLKILQEEIEMARYVDICRNALRKA